MSVTLPSSPKAVEAVPRFLFWGGDQKPILGGAVTQIERMGSRFALDVTLPPLKTESDGRIWVGRLIRGKTDGSVLLAWPQLDFTPGGNANGAVKTAVSGGTTLALKGLAASTQTLREGQFLSIVRAATGRRYLHMVAQADAVADALGELTITVEPMIRTAFSVDDVVEIGTPTIEGYLIGDERSWTLDVARHTGLSFGIEEIE